MIKTGYPGILGEAMGIPLKELRKIAPLILGIFQAINHAQSPTIL
jgi:hypothetical protein